MRITYLFFLIPSFRTFYIAPLFVFKMKISAQSLCNISKSVLSESFFNTRNANVMVSYLF